MALTPMHTIVGISLVKIIPNPFIGILSAFLSHFILDLYPECNLNDCKSKTTIALFGIVELFLFGLIITEAINNLSIVIVAGAISANIPDIWDAVNVKRGKKRFWCCHPKGWFPICSDIWSQSSLNIEANMMLDLLFIGLLLFLKWEG